VIEDFEQPPSPPRIRHAPDDAAARPLVRCSLAVAEAGVDPRAHAHRVAGELTGPPSSSVLTATRVAVSVIEG
jgi:hypothetical protein